MAMMQKAIFLTLLGVTTEIFGMRLGGYLPENVNKENMKLFNTTLEMNEIKCDEPSKVYSQVVNGTNFKFEYPNGENIIIHRPLEGLANITEMNGGLSLGKKMWMERNDCWWIF